MRNVKAICFSRENVVNLYGEEERARLQWVLSSFLAQNGRCFSSEIEKFLVASGKFLVASGKFLSAVGARAGLSRKILGLPIIKNIKVFRAKKVGF